jgi:hypothetical protein
LDLDLDQIISRVLLSDPGNGPWEVARAVFTATKIETLRDVAGFLRLQGGVVIQTAADALDKKANAIETAK